MATMWYKNVNCNVVYVDPSATGTATGVTPADALTDLPTPSAMSGGTVYLLRRGLVTPSTYTLGLTTSAQDVIAIWGMPLTTDEQYAMVPAEAKTEWDADAATQPVLQTVAQATTPPTFSGFGFSLHRVVLSLGFTAVFTAAVSMLLSGDAVSFTYVKVMSTGFDLATATDVTGSKHLGAIRCTGRSVRFADCEIQSPSTTDAYGYGSFVQYITTCAIYVGNRDGIAVFDNCTFRLASFVYGALQLYGAIVSVRTCLVNNCVYDLVDYRTGLGTTNKIGRIAMAIDAKILRVNNVSITTRQLGTQSALTPSAGAGGDSIGVTTFGAIGTPQFPLFVVAYTVDPSVTADGTAYTDWVIDTVTMDASGYRTAPSGLLVGPYQGSGGVSNGVFQVKIRNITFNAPQNHRVNDTVTGLACPSGPGVFIENCVVNYANTMAYAYAVGCMRGDGTLYYNAKATVRNCAGKGRLLVDSVRYAEFTSFEVVATDIASPVEVYGGPVYIGTLTMPAGWTSASMVRSANRGQLLIDSINIPVIYDLIGTAVDSKEQTITVANNGAVGVWGSFHRWNQVKTSTVYRTGGASAALYVQTNTLSYSSRYTGAWLAPRPFAAKNIAPGMTGTRKVTVYVAAKGVAADVVFRTVLVEVTAPSGAADVATYTSTQVGRLEVDASTWNNDTGLSIYKIVIPIKVDRLENLGTRVVFMPFASTTAYIYVDPKIEISS